MAPLACPRSRAPSERRPLMESGQRRAIALQNTQSFILDRLKAAALDELPRFTQLPDDDR